MIFDIALDAAVTNHSDRGTLGLVQRMTDGDKNVARLSCRKGEACDAGVGGCGQFGPDVPLQ